MPSIPTMSGPGFPSTPASSSSAGAEWFALTSDHLSGGVKSAGSRVTSVDTPWAISGSRVSATITGQTSTDGISEGYCWAVDASALLVTLGVTEDELLNGIKSVLVGMRQRTDPGVSCNAGVAFAKSTGETGAANTLSGGGGGFRSNGSTSTDITPMAFDSTQEAVGASYEDISTAAPVARLECFGGYWRASASMQVAAQVNLERGITNSSGFSSPTDPIWLVLWLGSSLAVQVTIDADISFAVTDGPNFASVPA